MKHTLDDLDAAHLRFPLDLPLTPVMRMIFTARRARTLAGEALTAPLSSGTFVYGPGTACHLPFRLRVNARARDAARCFGLNLARLRVVPLRLRRERGLPLFKTTTLLGSQ